MLGVTRFATENGARPNCVATAPFPVSVSSVCPYVLESRLT
jgi:hypothetical protein